MEDMSVRCTQKARPADGDFTFPDQEVGGGMAGGGYFKEFHPQNEGGMQGGMSPVPTPVNEEYIAGNYNSFVLKMEDILITQGQLITVLYNYYTKTKKISSTFSFLT